LLRQPEIQTPAMIKHRLEVAALKNQAQRRAFVNYRAALRRWQDEKK